MKYPNEGIIKFRDKIYHKRTKFFLAVELKKIGRIWIPYPNIIQALEVMIHGRFLNSVSIEQYNLAIQTLPVITLFWNILEG